MLLVSRPPILHAAGYTERTDRCSLLGFGTCVSENASACCFDLLSCTYLDKNFLEARETTGVDVSRDRIVELAATQGQELAHISGASFAEVVRVPAEIQESAGAQAAAQVHGI